MPVWTPLECVELGHWCDRGGTSGDIEANCNAPVVAKIAPLDADEQAPNLDLPERVKGLLLIS